MYLLPRPLDQAALGLPIYIFTAQVVRSTPNLCDSLELHQQVSRAGGSVSTVVLS